MAREETISPQPVLLGLLMSRPRHGYELYQTFEAELGRVWQIGMSQLYAHLHQLEETGQVAAHTEPQEGRPPRKVYHLTESGRAAFEEWLRRPAPYVRHLRVEFLARLYFYRARHYDPVTGRFLQRDPLGYVDGLSLFQYAEDRPPSRRDPNGTAPERVDLGPLAGQRHARLDRRTRKCATDGGQHLVLDGVDFGFLDTTGIADCVEPGSRAVVAHRRGADDLAAGGFELADRGRVEGMDCGHGGAIESREQLAPFAGGHDGASGEAHRFQHAADADGICREHFAQQRDGWKLAPRGARCCHRA